MGGTRGGAKETKETNIKKHGRASQPSSPSAGVCSTSSSTGGVCNPCALLAGFILVTASLVACVPQVQTVSGVVQDLSGSPVAGAVVRAKATSSFTIADAHGGFILEDFFPAFRVRVTSWQEGHYIAGVDVWPWTRTVKLVLQPYPRTDREDYVWKPPTAPQGAAGITWIRDRIFDIAATVSVNGLLLPLSERLEVGCQDCHPTIYDEWNQSAHALGANNVRFMSMYNGTSVDGTQSPPTRYVVNRDYGRVPIPPDTSQPYFGPGYRLDFPNSPGNCATCHLPTLRAVDSPYADSNRSSGVKAQGVHCDFCHKISDVVLDQQTGAPYDNRPGVHSTKLMRPGPDTDLLFGPYDDVDLGRDAYLPLIRKSEFCAPCHSAKFWRVPVYSSFDEWKASPYPAEGKTCQNCHMKPNNITTNFAPGRGGVERDPDDIATHFFPGASSESMLKETAALSVRATRNGSRLLVDVNVANAKAGHHLPTGSPLRQVFLVVTATDDQGRQLVLETGPTLPDWAGDLQGLAGVYFAKILQQLWTGQMPTASYWTPTRLVEDTRLPARGSHSSRYIFTASDPGEMTVSTRLIFRRAQYRLMQQKNWDTPDVLMEHETVELPERDIEGRNP